MQLTATNISPVNIEERKNLDIHPGDTVKVWQKIQEKGKTRLQAFEGMVLARKHGGESGGTFTVRKVSGGVGVEKIFPIYSPNIDRIEIIRRAKVRRSKLYYIREKVAREIKRQMRNARFVNISTTSEIAEADRKTKEAEQEELNRQEEEAKANEEAKQAENIEVEETQKEESTPEEENKKEA
jgi:large subunit ribosomal protein L19